MSVPDRSRRFRKARVIPAVVSIAAKYIAATIEATYQSGSGNNDAPESGSGVQASDFIHQATPWTLSRNPRGDRPVAPENIRLK